MKKYLFAALVAVAAIALVGCKKDDGPSGGQTTGNEKIVLSAHTLELAIGGEEKLRAALDPAKENVSITWTSSDPAVATVSGTGLVTGVAAGEVNVIASAEGYKADTCVVTVVSAADAFAWGGVFVSKDTQYEILNDKDTALVTLQGGLKVHCITISGGGFMWDNNIYLDNTSETGLNGTGYIAFLEVPVYLIVDSIDTNGANYYYVGAGSVEFVDAAKYNPYDTTYAYCAAAGALGDPAKQYAYWTADDPTGLEPGIVGTEIWYMDASTFRGYPAIGLVDSKSIVAGNTSEAYYNMNISWFEEESSMGLKVVQNAEGKYQIKEPVEWAATETQYYEKLPEQTAPRREIMAPNPKMENLMTKFKGMRNDRLYKK